MMDHRCYLRSSARIPAHLRVNGRWVPAIIRNVSEGGLYVETSVPVANGPYAMVTVRLRSSADASDGDLPALIVHRGESGVGLMVATVDSDHWLSTELSESVSGNATSVVDFTHLW